ncbi:hypothetical protein EHO57_14180 [Leptospira langatensis]|uniref:dATP/dGTP diphosphohydrolase N-terminal domain-containing protein n=1 Tax=Leptospira langatensis TaxID=2484983 RepID=A0A5R2ATM3_9LEPT|nr:dATP/dGTP diphosphohydrolase domain-containing protein [Leptospira langatensis]TGJ99902.1 hypothetical protein EHO57_14180 [Leptospira langatensis]
MEQQSDPTGRSAHEPGAKLDAGKLRYSLILRSMSGAITEVVKVAEYGARKYSVDGWRSVPDGIQRYTEALDRHNFAEINEDTDPESNLLHAAHLAWNALARLQLILEKKDGGESENGS